MMVSLLPLETPSRNGSDSGVEWSAGAIPTTMDWGAKAGDLTWVPCSNSIDLNTADRAHPTFLVEGMLDQSGVSLDSNSLRLQMEYSRSVSFSHSSLPQLLNKQTMGQDLVPDNAILSAIFPHAKPASVTILSKTFDTCNFRAQFDVQPRKDWPMDLVVHIEVSDDIPVLEVVTAIGKAANHQFPGLVPETYTCDKAITSDGRDVEYTVSRYLTGTVTLESVWPSLRIEQKESLVDAVVMASRQVHQLKSTDPIVKELLANTPFIRDGGICIGGPRDGYSENVREFLTHLVEKNQLRRSPTSDIVETADGVLVHSSLPELGQVLLTHEDFKSLDETVVLSHNDIEPRNISVQGTVAEDGSTNYELVGIIDCHRAGLFPFAFETAQKDLSLGNENLFLDWYMLFKEKTRSMIPPGGASEKLIRAVRIITKSKCMQQKTSVMAEFRRRWLEKERLDLSDDVLTGWERTDSGSATTQEPWVFSLEENIRLYDQVAQDCQ